MNEDERRRRWRLVLGASSDEQLGRATGTDQRIDEVLSARQQGISGYFQCSGLVLFSQRHPSCTGTSHWNARLLHHQQ